jgi:hypothetical protein
MTEHEHKLNERQGAAMAVVLVIGIILLCGWNKLAVKPMGVSSNIEVYGGDQAK